MKRRFLAVLLAATMAFALTACGGTEEESGSTDEAQTEESTDAELEDTLVVYSTHPEDMLETIAEDFTEETGVCLLYTSDAADD